MAKQAGKEDHHHAMTEELAAEQDDGM